MNNDSTRKQADITASSNAIKRYYEGVASRFYDDVWGESIHIGLFEHPDEDECLDRAQLRAKQALAAQAEIVAGCRVLEVACGWGATSRFLAGELGCEVVATNISDQALERAEVLAQRAGLLGAIEHRPADYHFLPFDDASFDVHLCQDAYLYAADLPRVLREANRVLRPEGTLVFTAYLMSDTLAGEERERLEALIRSPRMRSASEFLSLVHAAGFEQIEHHDWSAQLAPTFCRLGDRLDQMRAKVLPSMGAQAFNEVRERLRTWVRYGRSGEIGYGLFTARSGGQVEQGSPRPDRRRPLSNL